MPQICNDDIIGLWSDLKKSDNITDKKDGNMLESLVLCKDEISDIKELIILQPFKWASDILQSSAYHMSIP